MARENSISGRLLRTVGVGGTVVGSAAGIAGLAGYALNYNETLIGSHMFHMSSGNLLQDGFVVLAGAAAAGMIGRGIRRTELAEAALVKRQSGKGVA